MKVIHSAEESTGFLTKKSLAIGVFDGVHLGHQQVILNCIAEARKQAGAAVIVTFDRHPNAVVAPDRVPSLIYPLSRKIEAIGTLGADFLLLINFDRAFSQQSGEEFVRSLAVQFAPLGGVCVGSDFTFGHKRSGNVELLRRLGGELGFSVHGHAAVSLDGQVVSSTRIRECIHAGELAAASQMLGRPYSLVGKVISGDKRGREIGYPTANLDVTGLVLPPNGVYAALARFLGQTHQAVMNIGSRPTIGKTAPSLHVEVHLLEFSGDLYGAELEVTFISRLREERRFESLALLRDQITRDVAEARRWF
jgi:riboflavin kinase/FMN adenylyltransferase